MKSAERLFTKVFKKYGFTLYVNNTILPITKSLMIGFYYENEIDGTKKFMIQIMVIEIGLYFWKNHTKYRDRKEYI